MKTMKVSALRFLSMLAIAFFVFVTACKDEDTISFSSDDNANLQSDASMEAQIEDVSDMATVAMLADAGTTTGSRSDGFTGAREITGVLDTRLTCATVTLEFAADNDPGNPSTIHGYIYVDFGSGCTGPGGHVRKGRIVIEFIGRRYIPGSSVIITTEDYSVDGIEIEATRTETNDTESTESAPKFTISEEINVTFLDGTTASRTVPSRTRTWIRMPNPLEDSWTVTGSAFGTTRRGVEYTMSITDPLIFKRSCVLDTKVVMPVQGTKELVTSGKLISTDFGDGECDTKVTITVNGRSKEITISANGD